MKEKGVHEGCIEQVWGLFAEQMYGAQSDLDETGRWRMDTKELDDSIQDAVAALWEQTTTENLHELSDYAGYQQEFLKLFGFGMPNVDYDAEVNPLVELAC